MYIETNIRFDKMQENGTVKKVTEHYLVDALSFTEAEARITEEMQPYISGDFSVSAVKKSKIAEIMRDTNGDKFYLVKVAFVNVNEKTMQEKRCITQILVEASDFKEAHANFTTGMFGTIADYEIVSIAETPIIEVYNAKPTEA